MPAHCRVHRRVSPGVGSNSGHPSPLRDDDKGLDERVDARLRERTKSAIAAPTRVHRDFGRRDARERLGRDSDRRPISSASIPGGAAFIGN